MNRYRYIPMPLRAVLVPAAVLCAGFAAGTVNGLLGTGGGILLLAVLRRAVPDAKDAFAAALLCILPLSALSAVLYLRTGISDIQALSPSALLSLCLGAVPGGMLGAYLLDKLRLPVLELLFAGLLLFSGWRMLVG